MLVPSIAFVAGRSDFGKDIYVGRGNNSAWNGMKLSPGTFSIGVGTTMIGGGVVIDNVTAEYLVHNQNLAWIKVNLTTAKTLPNAVKWMNGNILSMIGKATLPGYQAIGRVRKAKIIFEL